MHGKFSLDLVRAECCSTLSRRPLKRELSSVSAASMCSGSANSTYAKLKDFLVSKCETFEYALRVITLLDGR
jgi:hypothetical protein